MGVCASSASQPDAHASPGFKVSDEYYTEEKTLGVGASCTVVVAKNKATGQRYAMKKLKKPNGVVETEDNEYLFRNETKIMSLVTHPNIVQFVEAFEDREFYHVVTGLCTGGELFDRVSEGSFSERDASRLAHQMLTSLVHCHKTSIVHRDLKPENFVFDTREKDSNMRLIDFGCALQVEDDAIVTDVAGSPYYVAPEVLRPRFERTGLIWKASDMWSIGVIVYLLVHGYPPFNARSQKGIFEKIREGKYRFGRPAEIKLSQQVKDFIRKLLMQNPAKRMTAEEALQHPWIVDHAELSGEALPDVVVKGLLSFSSQCKLKKAVGKLVAHQMSDADRENLQELFKQFDKNGDGQLGPDEIQEMLAHIGREPEDVERVMEEFDENKDGAIQFDEFADAVGTGGLDNEDEAEKLFRQIDTNNNGSVDVKELARALNLSKDDARKMVAEVDINQDGQIDFKEWVQAMGSRKAV